MSLLLNDEKEKSVAEPVILTREQLTKAEDLISLSWQ